jgi:hypothetical protein
MNPQNEGPSIITNTIQKVKDTIAGAKDTVQQSINEFSSKSAVDAGNEFLETNSLLAKFAFIILVLFGFLFLFRIGMILISYILTPTASPFLISGMIRGDSPITISQNSRTSSTIINYSENQPTGLEFTYSVWVTFTKQSVGDKERHIFNKGIIDGLTNEPIANAPGLYVISGKENTLRVYMDTFEKVGNVTTLNDQRDQIDITGVPFNKWINVVIRVENRILDVYVNGVLTQHKDLGYTPKQNFGDVQVCQNGGFNGSLSDLRYYPKALNVFEINSIVGWGPNLSTSPSAAEASSTSDSYYLSSLWYKNTQ